MMIFEIEDLEISAEYFFAVILPQMLQDVGNAGEGVDRSTAEEILLETNQ